jgi:hypothetical protein
MYHNIYLRKTPVSFSQKIAENRRKLLTYYVPQMLRNFCFRRIVKKSPQNIYFDYSILTDIGKFRCTYLIGVHFGQHLSKRV